MKRITYLKTLLVGLCAMVATSAWAGDEWSIDFAALGANYDDKTGVTISSEVATISNTSMGTCSVGEQLLDEHFILQTGTTWLIRKANGLYQGNSGGRAMGMLNCTKGQLITIVGTGDPNPSTNATLKSNDGNIYIYSVNEDGNVKFTPARYLYFTSISVANPSASAVDYKVIYMCGDTEIKEPSTYSGNSGDPATITSTDKDPIYKDGKKYIYTSDDSEGKTIASDGSTVITVYFSEALTYNYVLNATDSNNELLKVLAQGSQFEGDSKRVYYPKGFYKDNRLYMTSANNAYPTYGIDFTEEGTKAVTYTEDTENAYYFEVEDLKKSHSWAATGNQPDRYSNGLAARLYKNSFAYTEPLEGGIYTLTMWARNYASSSTSNIDIYVRNPEGIDGDKINFEEDWAKAGQGEKTITGITIPVGSYLVFKNDNAEWNSNLEMDYIILTKTGETPAVTKKASIGSNGYATFASAYNVVLPNNVTAYTAKVNEAGNSVNFTKVNGKIIPANTGVLLEGPAGEITFDVVASSSALGATNDFKVNTTGATFDAAENTTYFAMVKDSDPLKFGTVNPSSVAIPANKAYLAVVGNSEARLTVTFDGETTAIKSIENAETSNAIYNLNGQRVEKTQKGLYIVNGKKTIVK